MKLNDRRADAYRNASGKPADRSSAPHSESASGGFYAASPQKGREAAPEKAASQSDSGAGRPQEMPPQERRPSSAAPRPASRDLDAAESVLKSGGLLKVPVSARKPDGADSVYRRVAKFLLLIGIDEAAKILPHLSEEQTDRIIPEIASIRSVSPEEASVILAEFQNLLERSRQSGGVGTARAILEKAYGPDRAREMLEKAVPFSGEKPFEYLNGADSERVFGLLKDESPAVRALVLSRIRPEKAAAVIGLMTEDDKKDIVRRLAKMRPVSPDVIRRLDQAMREKSLAQTPGKADQVDGRGALAEILRKMPPQAEEGILSSLSEDDPELGQDLRGRLFTAEDVLGSDDRFLQEQLRGMSDSDVAVLVAGKPEAFRAKILSCVSEGRRARILDEERLRPVLKKDSGRVTSAFMAELRRAFEQGLLVVKGRNDDVFV